MPQAQDPHPVLLQELQAARVLGVRPLRTRRTHPLTQHKGHEFDKLTNVLAKIEEQLRQNLGALSGRRKSLNDVLEHV